MWYFLRELKFPEKLTAEQLTLITNKVTRSPEYLKGWDYQLVKAKTGAASSHSYVQVSSLLATELTKNPFYLTPLNLQPTVTQELLPPKSEWVPLDLVLKAIAPNTPPDAATEWFMRLITAFSLKVGTHYTNTQGNFSLHFMFAAYLFGKVPMERVTHPDSPLEVHEAPPKDAEFEVVEEPQLATAMLQPLGMTLPSPAAVRTVVQIKPKGIPDDPTSLTEEDLDRMHPEDLAVLHWRLKWLTEARPKQMTPLGKWTKALYLAGRGWGKTRVGAEAAAWYAYKHPGSYITVIAPTSNDLRRVCFEGESGLYSVIPPSMIKSSNKSMNELVLTNGSKISGVSAEEPERLRGLQHNFCWGDEAAAWCDGNPVKVQSVYDMMMFGLRLGSNPQVMFTTTPKPIPLIRKLLKEASTDSTVLIVRGSTYENKENLAPTFFKEIAQYEGTKLGRQEIHAEVLDPEESGIIKRSWFKLWPSAKALPAFEYVIQSYDTAFTDKTENDPTACTVWGVFQEAGVFNTLLVDVWMEHLTFDDLRDRMIEEFDMKYGEPGKRADIILIEDKGSGISIRQSLQKSGLPVRAYNPGRADKTQRLHAVSHFIANGRVWLPESEKFPGQSKTWADPFLEQVCSFPMVEHDDAVDTMTQALKLLSDQSWLTVNGVMQEEDEDYDYEAPRKSGANPYAC